MRLCALTFTAAAALALASTAVSQTWSDGFEAYPVNSTLDGQGGWHGWDAVNTGFVVVNDVRARSGTQSIAVNIGADTVREYSNITSGTWVYLGYVYVPSGYDGNFSYMIMNSYQDFGPYEWGSWVILDGPAGVVQCNCGSFPGPQMPLQYDRWVEIRKEIDLDSDFAEIYYDGQLLASYTWTSGWSGTQTHVAPKIEAIDLYPDPAVGSMAIWLDDLALIETDAPIGTSYCGPAIPNSTTFPGLITGFGTVHAASNDVTLTATQLPPGQFGYFLAGRTPGFFNPMNSSGLICLSGNIGRFNQVANIIQGPSGSIVVDTGSVPVNPSAPILSGETWYFQCWYRDVPATNNFTDGLQVTFL